MTTTQITTDTVIRTETDKFLGTPGETLAAKFATTHKIVGAFTTVTPDEVNACLARLRREYDPLCRLGYNFEKLTVGEVYALYVTAECDAADDAHTAAYDAVYNAGITGADAYAAYVKADRARTARKTKAIKAAYGCTYAQFAGR